MKPAGIDEGSEPPDREFRKLITTEVIGLRAELLTGAVEHHPNSGNRPIVFVDHATANRGFLFDRCSVSLRERVRFVVPGFDRGGVQGYEEFGGARGGLPPFDELIGGHRTASLSYGQ